MQRDKIKKKIITFLISTVVIYFVFLLAYNLLTYASAFRNLNLGISINDFYTKRWALPASGLYFETEVLVITIALVVAFIYLVLSFLSIISSIWYMTSDKTKDLRGSSAWASEEEIEENGYLFKWKDLKKKNGRKPSIILGQGLDVKVSGKSATKYRIKKNSQYLIGAELSKEKGKTPELAHTLIFGTTGSGKGVSTIIPTLLSHSGSLICYDPAGENFRETSDYRSNIGSVLYFNPQDMNSTLHFNPYDWIRRDSNFISTDIENMANIIIPTNPNAKDPFWDNMAKMLLNMYMSFTMLTANPDKCNMYQTTRILNTLFDEKDDEEVLINTHSEDEIISSKQSVEGNSSEVKEEEKKKKITFLAVLDKMEDILKRNLRCCWINEGSWEKTLATLTLDNISNFKMQVGSETTMGSIISVFNSHMSFYTNPNTAKLMDRTSFKPDDLLYNEKPLSIYLIILAEDNERCKTFVRVFCECVLSRLERDDARYKRDGRHTLLFLLDEFPLLGYMGTIEKAIPVTRKYGIAFCLITQDLAQLEKSYTKQGAVSLLNNMHIVNIKKSNDIDTANWISRSMGKQTLEISRTSFSKQRGSLMSNSSSTSTQSEGRDLLDASEVRRLENWKQIIFIQGTQPVLSAKIQWFGTDYFTKRRNEKWKEGSDTIDRGYGKRFEMSVEEEIVDEMDEIFAAIPCDVIADVKEESKINNVGQTDFLESFELEKMQESELPLKKENSMSDNHEKKEEDNSFLQDVAMDEKSDKAYNCW